MVVWAGGEEMGMIEDTSATGFGIRLGRSLSVGAQIEIRYLDKTYLATVRHCSEADGEYLIGVKLPEKRST